MKYQFKNIGPIKSAELELGGLTVIAGENNTGKTNIAHALYEFQKYQLERSKDISFELFWGDDMDVKLSFNKSGAVSGRIDVATATEILNKLGRARSSLSPKRGMSLLAGVSGVFSDADVVIPAKIEEKQKNEIFTDQILSLKRKGDSLIFSLRPSGIKREGVDGDRVDVLRSQVKAELARVLMSFALGSSEPPFISVAERQGISIFYKDLDFAKSRLVEGLQKISDSRYEGENDSQILRHFLLLSDSSARYSQSIKDNIDYTRNLDDIVKHLPELGKAKLFNEIEKMMKGSYKYENNGVIFVPFSLAKKGKAASANEKGDVELPLDEASSSVCCLSDMYFYLKYMARKNQLMIIDEPESHLDTANQIRMARLLARCVNAGLRVLITTHSDYIIKEFNNLIMLSSDFPEKRKFLKGRGKEYSDKEFLQKESVHAYACEKGGLSPCVIDNRGMDIALFDNTIDNISRVSDELDSYLPDEE